MNENTSKVAVFKGAYSLWLKDNNSVGLIIVAVVFYLAVLVGNFFITESSELSRKLDVFLSLAVISFCLAASWQILKLKANEYAASVPGFEKLVLRQCAWFGLLFTGGCLITTLALNGAQFLNQLLLATWLGMVFCFTSLMLPKTFYWGFLLYFAIALFAELTFSAHPAITAALCFLIAISYWLLKIKIANTQFTPALQNIVSGCNESGWYYAPNVSNFKLTKTIDQALFPLNYFTGSMLTNFVFLPFVVGTIIFALNHLFGWHIPLASQVIVFAGVCTIVLHWNRVNKNRSWELLLLIPIFSSHQQIIDRYFSAKKKLFIYLLVSASLPIVINNLSNSALLSMQTLLRITELSGLLLMILAAGSLCKTTNQLSLVGFICMLTISGGSAILSLKLEYQYPLWLANMVVIFFACVTWKIAKNRFEIS